MQKVIFEFPIDEFKSYLESILDEKFHRHLTTLLPLHPKGEQEYLTRRQTAKLLGVSLPTLGKWVKQGINKADRIGTRVRIKKSELDSAFCRIKTSKNK
jgi:excisionase family DNA binding protein